MNIQTPSIPQSSPQVQNPAQPGVIQPPISQIQGSQPVSQEISFEQRYAELTKVHTQLPALAVLRAELELEELEDKKALLFPLAKLLSAKLEEHAELLESILQPEHTLTAMHEAELFDEAAHEEVTSLLSSLMHGIRLFSVVQIERSDESIAAYIVNTLGIWQEHKPAMLNIAKKIAHGWLPKERPRFTAEYLG